MRERVRVAVDAKGRVMLPVDMPSTIDRIRKRGFVVAIDGPAGSGKSTLARALAGRVGLPYVNTGLMYRALAARSLAEGVAPEDERGLVELARGLRFSLVPRAGGHEVAVEPQGGPALTSRKVEDIVSTTSAHLGVRAVMRRVQRRLGAGGCVMEGRDIGTVVFADADVKIFLSAKPRERARRRTRERGQEQAAAVARRDALDSRTNPLEPAPDATVLDTTSLGPAEALAKAIDVVERFRGALA